VPQTQQRCCKDTSAAAQRAEPGRVRTHIFEASDKRQVAEMLLNHATLKDSYAGYRTASA
jgi:hypothetical protein